MNIHYKMKNKIFGLNLTFIIVITIFIGIAMGYSLWIINGKPITTKSENSLSLNDSNQKKLDEEKAEEELNKKWDYESSRATAGLLLQKAELYKLSNSYNNTYPLKISSITNLSTTDPAYMKDIQPVLSVGAESEKSTKKIEYRLCGLKNINNQPSAVSSYTDFSFDGSGEDKSFITTSLITGIIARFWNPITESVDDSIHYGAVNEYNYKNSSYIVGCVSSTVK